MHEGRIAGGSHASGQTARAVGMRGCARLGVLGRRGAAAGVL